MSHIIVTKPVNIVIKAHDDDASYHIEIVKTMQERDMTPQIEAPITKQSAQRAAEASKYEPFIKQHLGADYVEVPFDDLKISTATMDVRMHEHTELKYEELFNDLPVLDPEVYNEHPGFKWPAGTIFAAKFEAQVRGVPPTAGGVAFKNSTMIWIWLEEKSVNVKISSNSLHITGCKKVEQAAETTRLLQLHIQLLLSGPRGANARSPGDVALNVLPEQPLEYTKYYSKWPYALRFDVCMINYNFKLGVALDLPAFDIFVFENYSKFVFSSYDENINGTSMPMKCPMLSITYTVNDNGQISMCTKQADIGLSYDNVCSGYRAFYVMVKAFREQTQGNFKTLDHSTIDEE